MSTEKEIGSLWRKLKSGWMRFGRTIGRAQATVVLILFYFFIVVPVNIVMRIVRIDPLDRKWSNRDSYFSPRAKQSRDLDDFRHLS